MGTMVNNEDPDEMLYRFVVWLFLMMPRVCLQFVIVIFS